MSGGRAFLALWLALLLAKLATIAVVPLFVDEAWYWQEGQHPALAYSDLPGLTAWLVRIGVELGGHSEFGVRWPFLALGMAIPWLVRATASRLSGAVDADRAGLLALLLPLLGSLGVLALPDVPLTFASAACLYAAVRLCQRVEPAAIAWLALGLAIGALSHYRFAVLALAGLVGLALEPRGRAALADRRVWLALGIGVLAWSPLLLWNLRHGNAGVAFQFDQRHPWLLHGEGIWLPLSQAVVVGPLLLLLLLLALRSVWQRWRAAEAGAGLLFGAAAVPLATYLVLAFFADRDRVSFHWLLQAWMALLVAAPAVWRRWSRGLRAATAVSSGLLLVAGFGFVWLAAAPRWRAALADRAIYPANFAGYRELAAWLQEAPPPAGSRWVAGDFMLGAQLGFLLGRADLPVIDHPLNHKHGRAVQLQLWGLTRSLAPPRSEPTMLLLDDGAVQLRRRLAQYRELCAHAAGLDSPRVLRVDHGRRRFLRFDLPADSLHRCRLPAIAWLDSPLPGAIVAGTPLDVSGWAFKDGAGLERVEITLDGIVVATASRALAAPHVEQYWEGSGDPDRPQLGFRVALDLAAIASGDHWLGLVLHGRDGSVEPWPEQRLRIER